MRRICYLSVLGLIGLLFAANRAAAQTPGNALPDASAHHETAAAAPTSRPAGAAQPTLEAALLFYNTAINDPAPDPAAVRRYGRELAIGKHPDDAIALYRHAASLYPKDDELFAELGAVQLAHSEPDPAIDSLNTAIALNDDNALAHLVLGCSYLAKKQPELAQPELTAAERIGPKDYERYMEFGELSALSNRFTDAVLFYTNAGKLRPAAPEPYNNVGFALTREAVACWQKGEGDLAQPLIQAAAAAFQRAIDLKPDFQSAIKNLKTAKLIEQRMQTAPPAHPALSPTTTPATPPSAGP